MSSQDMKYQSSEIHFPNGPYERYVKRPLDFLISLVALIVLSPVFAVTAILVKKKLGSPVIFKQKRPGKDGKVFLLYKFRSMTNERDENGSLLPDTKRLTRFGRKLRALSLDELPELVNILKGDMAIVGPRPLSIKYMPYYTAEERIRHDVRPGLTGLAQANGRNAISWDKRFAYDIEYARNITFKGDVDIILTTVGKVLVHEGIGQGEERPVNLYIERADWDLREDGAVPPEK